MTNSTNKLSTPDVVKFTETANCGIRSVMLSRMAVCYLLKGRKYI